jgi:hypothetical protein
MISDVKFGSRGYISYFWVTSDQSNMIQRGFISPITTRQVDENIATKRLLVTGGRLLNHASGELVSICSKSGNFEILGCLHSPLKLDGTHQEWYARFLASHHILGIALDNIDQSQESITTARKLVLQGGVDPAEALHLMSKAFRYARSLFLL